MEIFCSICGSIYTEFHFIESNLEAAPDLIDLFMEQLLLCSLVGFHEEFITPSSVDHIDKWFGKLDCRQDLLCSQHTLGVVLAVQCLLFNI